VIYDSFVEKLFLVRSDREFRTVFYDLMCTNSKGSLTCSLLEKRKYEELMATRNGKVKKRFLVVPDTLQHFTLFCLFLFCLAEHLMKHRVTLNEAAKLDLNILL